MANKAISYPAYKAIKEAPSNREANELLITFIEQASDAAPWNRLLTTLQSPDLQFDVPILAKVLEKIVAAVAKTAASATVREPVASQKTAASLGIEEDSYDQQPLAPHQQILREKWAYLAGSPLAKNMADALFQQGISFTLLQRIRNASTPRDANEILLEYLYEADSDKPWQDFLQVLGSHRLWQDWPIMEEIHSTLMQACSNNR